jgi:hypothetical protein
MGRGWVHVRGYVVAEQGAQLRKQSIGAAGGDAEMEVATRTRDGPSALAHFRIVQVYITLTLFLGPLSRSQLGCLCDLLTVYAWVCGVRQPLSLQTVVIAPSCLFGETSLLPSTGEGTEPGVFLNHKHHLLISYSLSSS